MKKLIAPLVLILSIACSKEEAPVTSTAPVPTRSNARAPKADRMILRTADVKIVVTDTPAALQKITAAAEGVGGYVSDSRMWREGELLNATLTLRVPADKLTSTLAQIRGVAKRVDSENVSTSDVSRESCCACI